MVTARNATELILLLPRYLEELLTPFPATDVAFVVAAASPVSLVLRRGPESENNLPDI